MHSILIKHHALFVAVLGGTIVGLLALYCGTLYFADGASYLAAARSLAFEGRMLDTTGLPYVHWAPLLPVILAGVYRVGLDPISVGIMLNCVAFGVVAGCVSALLRRAGCGLIESLIFAIGVLLVKPLFMTVIQVGSEALFLMELMLLIMIVIDFRHKHNAMNRMLFVVLSIALVLTRYAGIFIIVPMAYILGMYYQTWKARIWYGTIFAMPGVLAFLGWSVRNYVAIQKATDRTLLIKPFTMSDLFVLIEKLTSGITYTSNVVIGGVMIVLLIYVAIVKRRQAQERNETLRLYLMMSVVISVTYFIGVLCVHIFFDRTTVFNHRMMSPAYILLGTAFYASCHAYGMEMIRFKRLSVIGLLLWGAVILEASAGVAVYSEIKNRILYQQEHYFELIRDARLFEHTDTVYSTGYDIISYATGHVVKQLPSRLLMFHEVSNTNYEAQMRMVLEDMKRGALIAYFDLGDYLLYPTNQELASTPGLRVISRHEVMTVYAYDRLEETSSE